MPHNFVSLRSNDNLLTNRNPVRSIALVILYLVSALVWAKPTCELRFLGEISKNAYHDQKTYGLPQELMDAIVEDGVDAWNEHYNCHDGEVFVFREQWPHREDEDLGFRVSFSHDRKGRFWLEGIKPSDTAEERDYFIRLAKCMDLEWDSFYLTQPIDNVRTVSIPPYVQIKLHDKHRLSIEEVQQAFDNRTSGPVRNTKRNNVQEFTSHLDNGKPVRVLVTYDHQQDSWVLVSMYHRK